jgi:hypothetical protein
MHFALASVLNPLACVACLAVPSLGYSQTYNTTLGLRLGEGIGISARQRLHKKVTAEGIFYQHHKSDQTILGLMADQHMPVLTKRLNIYAGGGFGRYYSQSDEVPDYSATVFLLNAGLEFTISRLNLSWDFMPVIPLSSQEEGLVTMTAFSLRYVLIKKSRGNKHGIFNGGGHHKKKQSRRPSARRKRR